MVFQKVTKFRISQYLVKNISEKLNIPVTENDLSDVFRIKAKSNDDDDEVRSEDKPKCPPLVVRFARKTMKSTFIKQRGKQKLSAVDAGFVKCKNRVYINEYLTKSNLELLKYAQRLKKYDVKYVWPAGGKILVRCDNNGTFSLDDKDHVNHLVSSRERQKSQRPSWLSSNVAVNV